MKCMSFSLLMNNHFQIVFYFPPTQPSAPLVKLEVLIGEWICQILCFIIWLYVRNLVSSILFMGMHVSLLVYFLFVN